MDTETTSHFFLPYLMIKESLSWIALNKIDFRLIETMESFVTETLLFGNSLFDLKKKTLILSYASIDYILFTKRFEEVLL